MARRRPRAAQVGLVVAAVLVAATLLLIAATSTDQVRTVVGDGSHLLDAAFALAFLAYSVVGATIVLRRPTNHVGWLFLVSGLGFHLWMFTWRYAAYGLVVRRGALPWAHVAAWIFEWIGTVGFGLAFTFLPQVFPDGSLPSPRWRPAAWFTATALAVWTFTWATAPGPLGGFSQMDNPVGIEVVGRLDLLVSAGACSCWRSWCQPWGWSCGSGARRGWNASRSGGSPTPPR